jgi:multiple sugar transport system permease protein
MPSRSLKYLMVAPLITLLSFVVLVPFAASVYMSVTAATLPKVSSHGVFGVPVEGIQQFQAAVTDPYLSGAVVTTLVFAVSSITVEFVLGTGLALLLNRRIKGARLFTTAMIIPILAPPVTVGLMWRFLLDSNLGMVNYALSFIGLPPFAFLASLNLALPSLILVDAWLATPFVFMVMLAGLRSLPTEPMEAALLDGANARQRFLYVTLPLLRPVIGVVVLLRLIDALRVFDVIYTLTGGGPGTATESVAMYIYRVVFEQMRIGYASALAVGFVVFVGLLSLLFIRSYGKVETT